MNFFKINSVGLDVRTSADAFLQGPKSLAHIAATYDACVDVAAAPQESSRRLQDTRTGEDAVTC